jgi:maltooligosyltrehalose synthase
VAAFARRYKKDWVLIVVPRWLARGRYPAEPPETSRFWGNTEVRMQAAAPTSWHSVFTGESIEAGRAGGRRIIRVDKLLADFPVAFLSGSAVSARAESGS